MQNNAIPSAHTKLPCLLDGPFDIAAEGAFVTRGMIVLSGDSHDHPAFPIAQIVGPTYAGREDTCDEELLANAAFIVLAANMHNELLDACKAAVDALNQIPNTKLSPIVGGIHKTTYSVCSMLDAVIEKTENKTAPQPKLEG